MLRRAPGRRLSGASPWLVDAVITAVVQAAVTIPFIVPRPADLPPATWPMYGLTSLQVLPLLWRTRAPLTSLLVITAAGFGYLIVDGPGQPLPYSPIVAIFTVAAQAGLWQRRVTIVLGLPLVALGVALRDNTAREHLFAFFLFSMVYLLGVLARTRQAYTEAVEARAAELERARVVEAERAAERERARIAREMHDILSHAVSLMIVQAEAGPLVVRSDPDRAEAAFDAISEAGRDAMTQLRRMLGVLKDDPEAGRSPQPTLAGLGALVDEVRRTGLEVSLMVSGEPQEPASDVQVTVYRVVQEALTNVLKHADARSVAVRLVWEPGALAVTVENDGAGVAVPRPYGGSGRGLIGIRERAAAHGGTAASGPGAHGRGFRVAVRLPLMISSGAEVGK
ncbi:sensor histidine kinase [Streptomyces netropsis]|uniref:Oxygen sensor histidine kinase NreB n=1 Tax=Streptomyces netropsis TaxID=55404 RepID=A0A7W7LF12_STRNE|nr:histidine kinase [Streptomyces netropsis]MBB4888496.1 signal transduction histidine kinase [Streptomyces netropsis]GGR12906.1 two-component sensor histidine kinase [Streptomyces netropsis]